ncbi:MAG: hypothetical protein ACREMA_05545, partial [Longimicrobiales bacterium]
MTARSEPVRVLPYDLAFDREFEQTHFPLIQAEAGQRASDPGDAEQFLQLGNVGAILRSALVEGDDTAVEQYGPLLFQAYNFWRADKPVIELEEPLFRHLVSRNVTVGRWQLEVPTSSGYLVLPRHRFWARIEEDVAPEAADGFFWHAAVAESGRVERLNVLLVLGVVPGRPGFSVIEVSGHVADAPAGHWGDAQARDQEQSDFANVLPGGELQQLHALQTDGEVLKFLSRVFWYVRMRPDALRADG